MLGAIMPAAESPVRPASTAGRSRVAARSGWRRLTLAHDLLVLARPNQWPKNFLVVPLVLLADPVWSSAAVVRVIAAAMAFTVCSAFTYVVNDLHDRHSDQTHPVKSRRPIAAGRVSPLLAWAYAAGLGCLAGALIGFLSPARSWPVLGYLLLGMCYSRWLKHVPLVDVFVIATGFLLRIGEGFLVTGTPLSSWLPICVLCLCLLFILGKRRHELVASGARYRRALSGYSVQLIDLLMMLTAVLSITTYLLFLAQQAPLGHYARIDTLLCAPFAIFGVFRYLQLLVVHRDGDDPVRLLIRDRTLVANSLVLAALQAAALLAAHYAPLTQSVMHKVV
jgi:4-hydroxybenzoate polyprenyltransferase